MVPVNDTNHTVLETEFTGRDILVLGAGRSGIAASRLLHASGARVTLVDDLKSADETARAVGIPAVIAVAKGYQPKALSAEALVLSPGIPDTHPLVASFQRRGLPILSEVEVAGRLTAAPVIAVTGSNGKSTVTTMIHQMAAAGGHRSFLGGNIGVPFARNVQEEHDLNPAAPVQVVEVSSFQAEHLDRLQPAGAVFLNLSPDHMDRYPDLETYGQAKLRVAMNIAEDGWIVYNWEDPFFRAAFEGRSGATSFGDPHSGSALFVHQDGWIMHQGERLVATAALPLPGPHNILNFLAAATAAHLFGVTDEVIARVMRHFQGLPHRLELAAEVQGVRYYNDSKATNVASTRMALASFGGDIILIMGGSDKGATDFTLLTDLIHQRVKQLITYGQAGLAIAEVFQGEVPIHFEQPFEAAVDRAWNASTPGDVVLLAPACASCDQCSGFEARGEAFRRIIEHHLEASLHA